MSVEETFRCDRFSSLLWLSLLTDRVAEKLQWPLWMCPWIMWLTRMWYPRRTVTHLMHDMRQALEGLTESLMSDRSHYKFLLYSDAASLFQDHLNYY